MEKHHKVIIASSLAGLVESITTMPFEVMKTRLQASSDTNWKNAFTSLRNERNGSSIQSLFAGLMPQMIQTSVKVGLRFSLFEFVKPKLNGNDLVAGLIAGCLEAILWVIPTERIKILRIEHPNQHSSTIKSLSILIRNKTLFVGGVSTILRNSGTVGLRFFIYDDLNRKLGNSFLAGFVAGLITTTLLHPIDVVKTQMMRGNVQGEKPLFKSNFDCAIKTFQAGGGKAYRAGLSARILKISTGQAIIFGCYDFFFKRLSS